MSTPSWPASVGCRTPSGTKLIPELWRRLLGTPGAALDNLNRMEKLGLLGSVVDWVEARNLRNRLVHEYMRDPEDFAGALNRAHQLVSLLVQTYDNLNRYAKARFGEAQRTGPPTAAAASRTRIAELRQRAVSRRGASLPAGHNPQQARCGRPAPRGDTRAQHAYRNYRTPSAPGSQPGGAGG